MTCVTTTDFELVCKRMEQLGYERHEYEAQFRAWLDRGDDVLVFSNHDLGSIGQLMLGMAMPWKRDDDTPAHGPDGGWGLGWRYLPDLRLTTRR